MVEMSRESISLRETNQSLEEELAEARRTGQTDIEELRSEFARRLATAEKKLQAVVKVCRDTFVDVHSCSLIHMQFPTFSILYTENRERYTVLTEKLGIDLRTRPIKTITCRVYFRILLRGGANA